MRFVFVSYAERTHFLSMVPLAWALTVAGHEVRVAAQPELVDTVTRAGLTAVPVGRDHSLWRTLQLHPDVFELVRDGRLPPFDMAETPPEEITWEALKNGYDRVVPWWWRLANDPMIEELTEFCRAWRPDLVIWEPATFAGPIAANACGAAHARLLWSVDLFGQMRGHYRRLNDLRPEGDRPDMLAEWLDQWARKFGGGFSEEMTTGHFTLDQLPPMLQLDLPLPYVPMRYVPYNGVSVVERWVWEQPERPRVCLTLGTSATDRFGGYSISLGEIFDALADLDIELVATAPDADRAAIGPVPANVRLVGYVPLHALVQSCAAAIHHGGWGTICTIAISGPVPQLVLHEQFDAPFLGHRIADCGAGLAAPMATVTGEEIRQGLLRLLAEPQFGEGAGRLRAEMMSRPTPQEIVPALGTLTAMFKPG
ncbi:activator-dependent family glycosyltransferase [Actinomadura sp. KC06]|uniref:activator-dependent family glycosyltransferase n=1 Tax=Actinomadura sp. KC06 TaxID=2530369 RepID=UPI00104C2CF1|nr:activator-dependent family glycosyltransferase [Actinomadura sp. KC06]TDD37557.1 activator-dependent family glycosyltransferase [Actinomadura sp. KC06]